MAANAAERPPSLTFYGDTIGTAASREGLIAIPVKALRESGLPSVTLIVNGVEVRALFDSGSPITVLNSAAARRLGLGGGSAAVAQTEPSTNPFSMVMAAVKAGQAAAQAATRGDALTVAGATGPVQLLRTNEAVTMSIASVAEVGKAITSVVLGDDLRPYVGELPGLAALNGLGAEAGPAAILGTDVLRRRPRIIYTADTVFL